MTNLQERFLELSKQYEELKTQMKQLKPEMQKIMLELGEGAHFQDPDTQLVYKIEVPTGTFIAFDPISYVRTKAPEEKRGSLAKSEAVKLGYSLK